MAPLLDRTSPKSCEREKGFFLSCEPFAKRHCSFGVERAVLFCWPFNAKRKVRSSLCIATHVKSVKKHFLKRPMDWFLTPAL